MLQELERRGNAYQGQVQQQADGIAHVHSPRTATPMLPGKAVPQPASPATSSCSTTYAPSSPSVYKQQPAPAQRPEQQGSVTSHHPLGAGGLHAASLADFHVGRVIGAGSFGRVSVARHTASGAVCVIKALSKAACIKDGQVRHVIDEKGMLARVSGSGHPFLVNLRGWFQDATCLYLVLDYVAGGEFFSFLRDYPARFNSRMREDHARFYAAQVVLALEHLHTRGIAYRDLKPENMLMDSSGYVKVTDFGFAKDVSRGPTYTMCGTPDYLAPEVILSQGHGTAVDWWALGCVIYEMLYGFPPFYAEGDPTSTYKNILEHRIRFPSNWSPYVVDLITGLLQPDPRKRSGVRGGIEGLKVHPWFQGLEWQYITAKKYAPPYVPKKGASADDTSAFDDYSKLGPMTHPFPLTPDQQKLFVDF